MIFSCGAFERERELVRLLSVETGLDVTQISSMNIIILQDNICGACTDDVLQFITQLPGEHTYFILSEEQPGILNHLRAHISEEKIFIDKEDLIVRYGLRYARDLIVVFSEGKVKYWAFIKEENFPDILKKMNEIHGKGRLR